MQYQCDTSELPRYLYRVDYPASQTSLDKEGLTAKDTLSFRNTLVDEDSFKESVQNHSIWDDRNASPFITLFSDRTHAVNWARIEPWRRNYKHIPKVGDWKLLTIETSRLSEVKVFKISTLYQELGLKAPGTVMQNEADAYICLHWVPNYAHYLGNGPKGQRYMQDFRF